MEPERIQEYRGYAIKIFRDNNPESPRTAWENLGTMYTRHRHYQPEECFDNHFEMEEVFDRNLDFLPSFERKYIARKVYLYDHSGQAVSTAPFGCRWDSGLFGIIAVEIEKVKKEYGWGKLTKKRRESIEGYLKGEIETYNDYLHGDVYRFELCSAADEYEIIESCGGFYGDESVKEIISECKYTVDVLTKQNFAKQLIYGIQQFLPFPEYDFSLA